MLFRSITLRENHDQLRATYETLGTLKYPIVVENIACASNSTIDQASLIKENATLKEEISVLVETNDEFQTIFGKYGLSYNPLDSMCDIAKTLEENLILRKELVKLGSSIHAMTLDDLLSKQRPFNNREGLGYVSKTKKKNIKKKEMPAQEKKKKVTSVGKAPKGKATIGDRTGPNNHYTLFTDYYGDVYAEYVGPSNGYAYKGYSIWVPKDLVAFIKEPINRWVPNSST